MRWTVESLWGCSAVHDHQIQLYKHWGVGGWRWRGGGSRSRPYYAPRGSRIPRDSTGSAGLHRHQLISSNTKWCRLNVRMKRMSKTHCLYARASVERIRWQAADDPLPACINSWMGLSSPSLWAIPFHMPMKSERKPLISLTVKMHWEFSQKEFLC